MRSQVDEAYAAADRLVREAEAAARERGRRARHAAARLRGRADSRRALGVRRLQAIVGLLETARTSVPPEVARQLAEATREMLLALRALIDWWIARLEREPERPRRGAGHPDRLRRLHSGGMATRREALRELPPESRLTGGAAAALIFSMVLPWYQVSALGKAESRSAFQVFTWVEAAILLVAAGVLYLVWARAQRQALPPARAATASSSRWPAAGCWRCWSGGCSTSPRSAGRRRRSASTGASSSRCWPPARWSRRARGCGRRAVPSRPTRSPRSPRGRCPSARAASAPTAARASTPRSRRCCASGRRRGRATRPSRRAGRSGRAEPDPPDPDDAARRPAVLSAAHALRLRAPRF